MLPKKVVIGGIFDFDADAVYAFELFPKERLFD
jgi:hypothetical protein